jgi:hypothetical protein
MLKLMDGASGPVSRRSLLRGAILLGVLGLVAACASMQSAPPERLAELRDRGKACSEALPAISRYDVDRFGAVRASASGSEADVFERNFHDCVFARGRWTSWSPGQPAPMLDPLGADNPDPELGKRVP